jgi:hypothetical protein
MNNNSAILDNINVSTSNSSTNLMCWFNLVNISLCLIGWCICHNDMQENRYHKLLNAILKLKHVVAVIMGLLLKSISIN